MSDDGSRGKILPGGDGGAELDAGDEMPDEELLELLRRTEENRRWIREAHTELVERYSGQYVCVRARRVIASGADVREMLRGVARSPDMVCEYIAPHGTAMLL